MQILITAIGSYGDVHPMVGLGRRLRARGHDVTIAACPYFEELVARAGLPLAPLGTREMYLEMVRDPDLWHPTRGIQVVAGGISQGVRLTYDLIAERCAAGELLVVAAPLDFGARIAHDKLGVPTISVPLAPSLFRSVHLSPVLPPALWGPWVPKWFKRCEYWAADRVVDRLFAPAINALRAEIDLPPVTRIMKDWWHAPERVLGMFPAWYGPPQVDWPSQVRLTSFPLWDESEVSDVPGDAAEFITRGAPPIVFTPGSAMAHGQEFFRSAVEACERLEQRGMLLTRYAEQIPAELPDTVKHFSFVPLSYLLPRSAAIVHHGGVGTVSQGLAAGVPQLVMPMSHDQPDNAARLARLGVAASLAPRKFQGRAVARALEHLITSPQVARACRDAAGRLEGVDGLGMTCDLIEEFAGC